MSGLIVKFVAGALAIGAWGVTGARAQETMPMVAESPEKAKGLPVGARVPEVMLRTPEGKPFSLGKAGKEQPTVLIFYRGGWCPYCNTHLAKLGEIEPELKKLGYRILAVSPDRPEELKKSLGKHALTYQLASDSKADAAKAFGLAFRVEDALVAKYKTSYRIDLEASSGETHHILPVPAVFVLRDGVIRFAHINPDYRVRLSPERILEAARSGAAEAKQQNP